MTDAGNERHHYLAALRVQIDYVRLAAGVLLRRATIATVIVFGAWAGFLARPMPGPTPWLGLAERVNIYATMLWIAVLAASSLLYDKYS